MGHEVDVVIVNWNAGGQLRECVASVLEVGRGQVRSIVVVDNASTDGSVDNLPGDERLLLLRATSNMGFSAACNRGAREGGAPYLLFLNPDTRLETDSLSVPLAFMERPENSEVGICGIRLIDEHNRVARTCARFPTLGRLTAKALGLDKLPGLRGTSTQMTDWDHATTRWVDQVIGAFFFTRRALFDQLGGFDERFFVYFEEVDLSLRSYVAGWSSVYLAQAQAFHAGGGTSRQVKARRLFYFLRSRLLYGFKHFPRRQAWTLLVITGMVEPLVRMVFCATRGDGEGVQNTWRAYRMVWGGMDRIVRGEGRFQP